MRIEIDLRGELARRAAAAPAGGRGTVELPEAASVAVLASVLGLPAAAAVFVVNGAAVTARHQLCDGDRVQGFPAAAGG